MVALNNNTIYRNDTPLLRFKGDVKSYPIENRSHSQIGVIFAIRNMLCGKFFVAVMDEEYGMYIRKSILSATECFSMSKTLREKIIKEIG